MLSCIKKGCFNMAAVNSNYCESCFNNLLKRNGLMLCGVITRNTEKIKLEPILGGLWLKMRKG